MMLSRGWKITILTALGIGAVVFAYLLQSIFMPLLVALIMAYILNPVLVWLEDRKVPRMASIAGVYVVLAGLVALVAFWAVPAGVSQARAFVQEVTKPESKARKLLAQGEVRLRAWLKIEGELPFWKGVMQKFEGKQGDLAEAGYKVAKTAVDVAISSIGGVITVLSFVALVPVYLFFLLKNLHPWWERVKHLIPRAYRDPVLRTLGRIHQANASFFRGQLTISVIEGAIVFVALGLWGVKLSLLFGLMYAVLSLVPYLGVILGFAVIEIFVLADTGTFGSTFLFVAILFSAIQVLESWVLQPMILGKETGLHPIAIILALLICGDLFGFFGLLIGVPIAATVKILLEDYVWPMFEEVADLTRVTHKPPAG